MSKNDGGTAFPCRVRNDGVDAVIGFHGEEINPGITSSYGGMSLRDYFAAKALESIVGTMGDIFEPNAQEELAGCCYKMADAMLAARVKP